MVREDVVENNVGQKSILQCQSGYIVGSPSTSANDSAAAASLGRDIVCHYDDLLGSYWRYETDDGPGERAQCIEGRASLN